MKRILASVRRELDSDHYEISAGINAAENDVDVDRVVGAAELEMRADKDWYYKHDKSKRRKREMNEELERMITEKQDADSFIEAISSKYSGVYLVDLRHDTPRDIYMPRYFKVLLKENEFYYGKALESYANKFVKKKYHVNFEEILDYVNLEARLREGEVVEFKYQKIDNEWMYLRILELENTSDDKFETIWIFSRGKN